MKTCPDCLERVEDDARTCVHCGHSFHEAEAEPLGSSLFGEDEPPPSPPGEPLVPLPESEPLAPADDAPLPPPPAEPAAAPPPPSADPYAAPPPPPPPLPDPYAAQPPPPPPPTWTPPASTPPAPRRAPAPAAARDVLTGRTLAGWGSRFGAIAVDLLLLAVVLLAPLAAMTQAGVDPDATDGLVGMLVLLAWPFGIAFAMEVTDGQTPGKRLAGIRVVRLDGSPAGFGTSLVRDTLVRGVLWIIPIVSLVDVLLPLWDGRKQSLHDKIAGTLVVRDADEARRPAALAGGLAVLTAAVIALLAVGGLGDDYSQRERLEYVDACVEQGTGSAACECEFDWIAENVPYEEFERQEPKRGAVDGSDEPVAWQERAIAACADLSS